MNVFTLFDYGTLGNEMVRIQKENFARNVHLQVRKATLSVTRTRCEIDHINNLMKLVSAQSSQATPSGNLPDLQQLQRTVLASTNKKTKPSRIQIVDDQQNVLEFVPGLENLQVK